MKKTLLFILFFLFILVGNTHTTNAYNFPFEGENTNTNINTNLNELLINNLDADRNIYIKNKGLFIKESLADKNGLCIKLGNSLYDDISNRRNASFSNILNDVNNENKYFYIKTREILLKGKRLVLDFCKVNREIINNELYILNKYDNLENNTNLSSDDFNKISQYEISKSNAINKLKLDIEEWGIEKRKYFTQNNKAKYLIDVDISKEKYYKKLVDTQILEKFDKNNFLILANEYLINKYNINTFDKNYINIISILYAIKDYVTYYDKM